MPITAVFKSERFELVVADAQRCDIRLPMSPHPCSSVVSAIDAKITTSAVVSVEPKRVITGNIDHELRAYATTQRMRARFEEKESDYCRRVLTGTRMWKATSRIAQAHPFGGSAPNRPSHVPKPLLLQTLSVPSPTAVKQLPSCNQAVTRPSQPGGGAQTSWLLRWDAEANSP
jgi:hypothetical protein|eukprot:COSAG06_NODE_1393_length_9596_cov_47.877014_8_plen_173_part_00